MGQVLHSRLCYVIIRGMQAGNRQSGFVTMIVMLVLMLVVVIYFAYKTVAQAQQ